ncbi:hypothetical protein [Nonomuraea sp. NPDC049750]|uniref:hypothetical protein n=1 Tax=Nonomuraea sp. NPDC049750 TaxID=3154738 RepID=UPI0033DD4B7D
MTALVRDQLTLAREADSGQSWDGMPGDLLVMPERRHRVEAVQDCAFLFTTAR